MIDTIISLAFSIYSNKGVYALLLGSGVSRSADIPTGWEIVLDLIRKLSHLENEDCEPHPEVWYKKKFGKDPDYSKLLGSIVKSPAERNQLLRRYFEPTEEEREQGKKVPMVAHKAIAELVVKGFIKVIITTNFDRLLEKAIEEIGVTPTIISTVDSIEGALPIIHSKCTIIKVHGDYLDTRIKNTSKELETYDKRLNKLLDRIFDEFGIIVCGWSAEWDAALRAAIERCKNFRFSTFWTIRGEPNSVTKKLIEFRRAEIIKLQEADSFFQKLGEKVLALEEISRPHPLSIKLAVASLKKYLTDDRYRIMLADLIMEETEKLFQELGEKNFPVQGIPPTPDSFINRIQKYEALSETIQALIINGCYWGEEKHIKLWINCLERFSNYPELAGYDFFIKLKLYPALLLLYSGGISSIVAEKYFNFASLLAIAKIRKNRNEVPIVLGLNISSVIDYNMTKQVPEMKNMYTPISDRLFNLLRDHFRKIIPQDIQYQKTFDKFEYLLALIHVDHQNDKITDETHIWAPIGCFGWRHQYYHEGSIMKDIELEALNAGNNWAPLKFGLFKGSIERFKIVKKAFDERVISRLTWY